ncbi:MAG: class II fructose-bisphosphate aldolase [Wigglesworthia glossinidia]|nr:class II fructose-bisphosphate aldolase [Wigglesworthia glossinidia]
MQNILKSIGSGVIFGNKIKQLFDIAKIKGFAIPAINCIGTDSINASLEAASKLRAPIIIQFSYSGSSFIAGKKINSIRGSVLGAISGALHVHNVAKDYNIPVILHTDHCSKKMLPWIDALIIEGKKHFQKTGIPLFSSHMIDLSAENLKENINISSMYLTNISPLNMMLEIELGCTGGEEDGINNQNLHRSKLYTKPEDVVYAYENLIKIGNNFIIAASFGNCHGVYRFGNIKLKPEILKFSQQCVAKKFGLPHNPLNLVFHGGSGSDIKDIKRAIKYGIVKINIDTDTQWATWKGILDFYKKNKNYLYTQLGNPEGSDSPNKKFYDPRNWLRCAQLSMIDKLEAIFYHLNSVNIL